MALSETPTVESGRVIDLDTPFMLSDTRPSFVSYTVELDVTAPLLSSEFAQVELMVGNPPEINYGTARIESAQLAGLGLISLQSISRQVLTAWVPANASINLVSSGGGNYSVVNSLEVTF